MNETFFIGQRDQLPWMEYTLLDGAGVPIDLTQADRVQFVASNKRGQTVIDGACIVDADPTTGRVVYRWAQGDTAERGELQGEFRIWWQGNVPQTVPNSGFVPIRIDATNADMA